MYDLAQVNSFRNRARATKRAKETVRNDASVAKVKNAPVDRATAATLPRPSPVTFILRKPEQATLPKPSTTAPGASMEKPYTGPGAMPTPPKWVGGFRPAKIDRTKAIGALRDEIGPLDVRPVVDYANLTPLDVPTPGSGNTGPQLMVGATSASPSPFWSGLGNLLGFTATKYAQTQSAAALQQAQQRALINTWNPALTGPALQAQAYQNAFMQGNGSAPMSGTTLALIGAGILGVVLLARR